MSKKAPLFFDGWTRFWDTRFRAIRLKLQIWRMERLIRSGGDEFDRSFELDYRILNGSTVDQANEYHDLIINKRQQMHRATLN